MPTLHINATDLKRLLNGETIQHPVNGLRVVLDQDAMEMMVGHTSTLPGGIVVTGGTDEQHAILRKRGEFVAQYCQQKGWDVNNVTMPQLLEIRSQQGWKEPQ